MQVVIGVTKTAIMAVRETDNPVNNAIPIHVMPRSGDSVLRQPIFDWKGAEKYQQLCNSEIVIKTF